ncbi:MAG: CcoQ/FixQ family Cbb3-type cytochrome c oxidase assembly chaperone [Bacteroidetes bacterium]|nr:CcoQ/FixQ family Cbb3-type cytochrome c oxidase assembly chaperone [Bacteroidota bacterium]
MFKDFIKQDTGMQIYPILSLLVFIGFFVLIIAMAYAKKKSEIDEASRIPLDENDSILTFNKE